jgi:hypothetical protein
MRPVRASEVSVVAAQVSASSHANLQEPEIGGLGADVLIGGAGTQDAASYEDATSGVSLSLATGGTGGEATITVTLHLIL